MDWKYQIEEWKYRVRDGVASGRDLLKDKPAIGFGVAGGALLLALVIAWFRLDLGGAGPTVSPDRVTVRFDDTGDEMELDKLLIERSLRERTPPIDPAVGITNPKTDKPTGFPTDRDWWTKAVEEASRQAEAAKRAPGRTN